MGPGSALDVAIRQLLRPFRRHSEPEEDPIPAEPAGEPMAEEQPGSLAATGGLGEAGFLASVWGPVSAS